MLTTLRVLRMKANISQGSLAASVGVAQPVVSNWESGLTVPRDRGLKVLEILKEFTDISGVTPEELNKPYETGRR